MITVKALQQRLGIGSSSHMIFIDDDEPTSTISDETLEALQDAGTSSMHAQARET